MLVYRVLRAIPRIGALVGDFLTFDSFRRRPMLIRYLEEGVDQSSLPDGHLQEIAVEGIPSAPEPFAAPRKLPWSGLLTKN